MHRWLRPLSHEWRLICKQDLPQPVKSLPCEEPSGPQRLLDVCWWYAGLSAAGFHTAASMVQQEGSSAPCSLAQQQPPCQALSTEKAVEEHLSPPVAEPLSPSSVLASPFQLSTACPSPEAAEPPEGQRFRQPLMPAKSALPQRLLMLKRRSLDWLLHKLPGGTPEDTPELDMLNTRLSSGLLDPPGPKKDLGKPAEVNWYLASVDSPVTRALLALEPQHRHFYEAEQQAQYRLQHTAFCKAFWVR